MLIGGQWVESASGEMPEVEDPAHRRPVAAVPRGRAEDVGETSARTTAVRRARRRISSAQARRRGDRIGRADGRSCAGYAVFLPYGLVSDRLNGAKPLWVLLSREDCPLR